MEVSVQQHLLPAIVVLVMCTIGMELRWEQFQALIRAPSTPIIGTLIHTLTFPMLAMLLVVALQTMEFTVSDSTVIGMLLIAACPSGGFSNVLALIARVNLPLSVTLTLVSSLLSFATVPLLIGGFGFFIADLDQPVQIPVVATLQQLCVLILLPIGAGMAIRRWQTAFVESHLARMQNLGQVALYICVVLLIVENWSVMVAGVMDALPWSILLCGANILTCYYLAQWTGFVLEDRITIALEGSIRNIAVALLIAATVLQRMDIAVLPTVYFLAVLIVALLFAKTWRLLFKA